jgi:hypothetical protein
MISGTISDARTGLPIAGARVEISGTSRPPDAEVFTDNGGTFVFSNIAAGRYAIKAKRSGYFDADFGQRQPLGPGTPIALNDGERMTGLSIPLVKPAAVTGTVLDDGGEPVVKLAVRAYVRTFKGGRPHYEAIATGLTDDRGVYRIGRLVAGDFLVGVPVTRPRGTSDDDDDGTMPRDGGALAFLPPAGNGRAQVYPSAYFPAGVAAPYATAVALDFGEVRRNIDLQIRPAPAYRVTGSLLLRPGAKRTGRVRLAAVDEDAFEGGEVASIAVAESGTFAVGGIPPGQYVLRAETADAWAAELISISDADLTDVQLQMRGPLRVSGRVSFEGDRPEPDAETSQGLSLSIERADGGAMTAEPNFSLDRTGRNFVITGVLPGRYVVRLERGLPSWLLRSASLQGRDVSLTAFEVTNADVQGLAVTLTDRITSVSGTVSGAENNVSVFVFPQDQQRWVDFGSEGRAFRVIDAGNGPFEVTELPPGDYVFVAAVGDSNLTWKQPSFLQAALRVGTAVRVVEGAPARVDLKVVVVR